MSGSPSPAAVRRWRQHLADSRRVVYRELAGRREVEEREILLALAEAERRHAAHWAALLGDLGPGRVRPSARHRVPVLLARQVGSVFVAVGAGAATVTYLLGSLFGATVG